MMVAVEIQSLRTHVAGFDSERDLVDLVSRISDPNIFKDVYTKKIKGTLGDNLAEILIDLENISKENQINLHHFLEMRKRIQTLESSTKSI